MQHVTKNINLEQLPWRSVCGPAKENWMTKSQNMLVLLSKWFWPIIFAHDAAAEKGHNKV
jgi:hypothetical protein